MRLCPLSVLALVLSGCGGSSETAPTPEAPAPVAEHGDPAKIPLSTDDIGEVVATVGADGKIGSKDFQLAAARTPPADGAKLSPDERKEILDRLVMDEVLYQEAAKQGLYRDPKVRKIMVNLLLREAVYASVRNSDFTNDELKAYYDAHQDEFVVPEKIQVKRIFIKASDKRSDEEARVLADELYAKVKANPASFSEVAGEFSEDAYKRRGGDLGYLSKEGKPGVDQEVIDKAFTLNADEISAPFMGGGGYNILQIAGKRERVDRTFEQMKGSVLRKLKNDRYKELTDQYIEKLRASYPIEVKEDLLSSIEVQTARRPGLAPELDHLGPAAAGRPDLDEPLVDDEMREGMEIPEDPE